jgi:hypothetical protein
LNSYGRNVPCAPPFDAGFGSVVLVHASCGMSDIQNLMRSSIFIGALSGFLLEYFSLSKKQKRAQVP